MKNKEILLVRKVFTSGLYRQSKDRFIDNVVTKKTKLLAAYNDLLLSLMPEILEQNSEVKKLYMCKMTDNLLLLELTFGEINSEKEFQYSIDPYSFVLTQILS